MDHDHGITDSHRYTTSRYGDRLTPAFERGHDLRDNGPAKRLAIAGIGHGSPPPAEDIVYQTQAGAGRQADASRPRKKKRKRGSLGLRAKLFCATPCALSFMEILNMWV